MAIIDEILEIVWSSKAAGRREIPCGLVTPGPFKGVLRYRKKLDVGIAHLLYIGDQLMGQLPVTKCAVVLRRPPPAAQVDFVDIQRLGKRLPAAALFKPRLVPPRVSSQRPDAGRGARGLLGVKAVRVRLVNPEFHQGKLNRVLVCTSRLKLGRNEEFPDPLALSVHRLGERIPTVELADYTDTLGIRRPNRELHTADAIHRPVMCSKLAEAVEKVPFTEQVSLVIREPGPGQLSAPFSFFSRYLPKDMRRHLSLAGLDAL